ncbi:MAG TPA: aldehyde dehydrogenase [Baekduia sp.]|nr:aldehyde dehydrogenase [Baekduia sp.]
MSYQLFIDGTWVPSSNGAMFPAINPFTAEVWAEIPEATTEDVDAAVRAARRAYDEVWRDTSGRERARLMTELARLIDANAGDLSTLETTDNGKVIRETKTQMHFTAGTLRFFAGYADKLNGSVIPMDSPELFDYTLREPRGVAALITAWNSPIQILANKLPAALAAGNTIVVKPSEHTSASTLELARLVDEAGFPAGVFNVVTGAGAVGHALTSHPDVDIVSLTGGVETGVRVAHNAADNIVPVILELGGKSANIIFDDADLDRALPGAVAGIFAAAGQTCIAGSRLLVQRSIYDQVLEGIVERAQTLRMGDPLDPETEMGPVAHRAQHERVSSLIAAGVSEGARLVAGGPGDVPEAGPGYFIRPTVFADVDPNMSIAQEEIFGPVLSALPFDDEEDALRIANATQFGLAAGVWTRDLRRAHTMARRLRSGVVWVNTYRASSAQGPFGGTKRSGYGRERGLEGLLEFTQIKNVIMDLSTDVRDPFSLKAL